MVASCPKITTNPMLSCCLKDPKESHCITSIGLHAQVMVAAVVIAMLSSCQAVCTGLCFNTHGPEAAIQGQRSEEAHAS